LKAATTAGERLHVRVDEEAYEIEVRATTSRSDLWKGYNPGRVRAAVRRSAALGTVADAAELDSLIAEIRAKRDQAPVSRKPSATCG